MPGALLTGSTKFIGYNSCKLLPSEGFEVIGQDAMTDYYDISLQLPFISACPPYLLSYYVKL